MAAAAAEPPPCLRLPAEGPCECDLVLTCAKFLTTSDYTPQLRVRLDVEQRLIDDASARGWQREIERHTATKNRIRQLLDDLDTGQDTGPAADEATWGGRVPAAATM